MCGRTIIKTLLDVCEKYNYYLPVYSKCRKHVLKYIPGYLGSLFQENFKQQWLHFCTSNHEISFFVNICYRADKNFSEEFMTNLINIKDLCNSQIPFGVANIYTYDSTIKNHSRNEGNNERCMEEVVNLNPGRGTVLQSVIFVSPMNSRNLYFQWQRQRKIWWSRFSVSPGHFSITDESNDSSEEINLVRHFNSLNKIIGKKCHGVHIMTDFEKESYPMESVQLFEQNPNEGITVEDKSGVISPHLIVSTMHLERACIGMLLECLDDNGNMILHKKLAPFQYRVICDPNDTDVSDDLADLARYLCGLLRKSNLSTIYVKNREATLIDTFNNSDRMGIPYCLILQKDTLKNGFLYLRNRDTTLQEQLHVSDVPDYLVKLCKN